MVMLKFRPKSKFILKSNELLSYLSDLELKLNSFSFEELTSEEASRLKKSFQSFKENLEGKKISKDKNTTSTEPIKKIDLNSVEQKISKKQKEGIVIANVSHEIRTPLNCIKGFTDLLSEEKLTELQYSYVTAIQTASDTLLNIINQLLEYSKFNSGTVGYETIEFNFYNVLKEVTFLLETLIVNEDVSLNVTVSNDVPEVIIGDPSKLSQVILNLVGNSIKFVDKGNIDLIVRLESLTENKVTLNFKVKDTGIGIAKNQLENIFNYYQQAEPDTHKNYGGTGLGLGIVKNIIESLGGKISVTSELGIGTEFNFLMPYSVGSLVKPLEKKGKQNANKNLFKDLKILVFEDSFLNQKLIENRLNSWGCKVFITDNEEEGLIILENENIELILMDLRLPNTTGFTISKNIRNANKEEIKFLPIIALTADFTVKDKDLCIESGINDYLLKPFDSKELIKKIKLNINKLNNNITMKISPVVSKINTLDSDKIDLGPVLEECFGDLDMLEELVMLYKSNAMEFIGKTKIDLKARNVEGIRFNSHKIKSGLKMMQTPGLHRIVEQMHKICLEDQDIKYLQFLYSCFIEEYPAVEKAIDLALNDFKSK